MESDILIAGITRVDDIIDKLVGRYSRGGGSQIRLCAFHIIVRN
jgi:hypothetical protein